MKTKIFGLTVMLSLAAVLGACEGGGTPNSTPTEPTDTGATPAATTPAATTPATTTPAPTKAP